MASVVKKEPKPASWKRRNFPLKVATKSPKRLPQKEVKRSVVKPERRPITPEKEPTSWRQRNYPLVVKKGGLKRSPRLSQREAIIRLARRRR